MADKDKPAAEAAGPEDVWDQIDREESGQAQAAATPPDEPEQNPETDATTEDTSTPNPEAPEEAAGDDSAAEEAQEDPWEAVPEALRTAHQKQEAELEKLRQSVRSNDGRIAAYQRQIRELQEAQASENSPTVAAGAPQADKDTDDELDALLEEYPEIGKPFVDHLRAQQAKIAALEQQLGKVSTQTQTREEAHYAAQEDLLTEAHSDWKDVLSEENAPTFHAWLRLQGEDIKAAAQRNATNIADAQSAAKVVGAFKDFLSGFQGKPDNPAPKGASSKRDRQLAGATTVRSTGGRTTAPGVPEEGNPQEIWDAIEREEAAKRQR